MAKVLPRRTHSQVIHPQAMAEMAEPTTTMTVMVMATETVNIKERFVVAEDMAARVVTVRLGREMGA